MLGSWHFQYQGLLGRSKPSLLKMRKKLKIEKKGYFLFSQLEHLNDYHAQYVHFIYEKCQICNIALQGIIHEARATLKSMCYGGVCSLDIDDMWYLFESLAWYQWHHENGSEFFVCPSPIPYDLRAQSPCVDQFRDSFHHRSSYSPFVRSYCQSFVHNANPCPYYDIFDECYARLIVVIETMSE